MLIIGRLCGVVLSGINCTTTSSHQCVSRKRSISSFILFKWCTLTLFWYTGIGTRFCTSVK
ncbi:hypothetical protein RSAG8_06927, partial [Rhizoctonia solani AG-8 WAC10335]